MMKLSLETSPMRALGQGFVLLEGAALLREPELLDELTNIIGAAPLRTMVTPGGYGMSVRMTNCGQVGWVSDRSGYRYSDRDPESGKPWPAMPQIFSELAKAAAERVGFRDYAADACLVNRYEPKAKLSLHQDKDEQDFSFPIVSISLGLPATFLFGGLKRKDPVNRILLSHGDVVVWGGPNRLAYHGVAPIKDGIHPKLGACRINLTFRKAL
jgi:alkylated DNA repair protein (DNA oxidative demethylase)